MPTTDIPHSNYTTGASAENIALDKQILRARIRPHRLKARAARGESKQQELAGRYLQAITSLIPEHSGPLTIAAYLPTKAEPPITEALTQLHGDGHRILVPVVRPGRTLAWVEWDPQVAHPLNSMGIAEPEGEEYGPEAFIAADIRLVPALAYGQNGRRLGQGGGYYDRLLPKLAEKTLREATVGVVFSDEVYETIPFDTWDATLHRVLTENGVHKMATSAEASAPLSSASAPDPHHPVAGAAE